jgi:hypothetical protein
LTFRVKGLGHLYESVISTIDFSPRKGIFLTRQKNKTALSKTAYAEK